jgi:hypothetical protein
MQQPSSDDFVEIARARDEIEAIMVSRLLSTIGIRVAGTGRSIQVPRAQYTRAYEHLRSTPLILNEEDEAIAYASTRGRAEEWAADLRSYRIPYTIKELESGLGFALHTAVPDVARSRELIWRHGLVTQAELSPPEAGDVRHHGWRGPDQAADVSRVGIAARAAVLVAGGLFLLGAVVGLLGFVAR